MLKQETRKCASNCPSVLLREFRLQLLFDAPSDCLAVVSHEQEEGHKGDHEEHEEQRCEQQEQFQGQEEDEEEEEMSGGGGGGEAGHAVV